MVDVFSGIMVDAYPLAGTLLIISGTIFSLLYMASVFFDARKLKSWVANEAFQALATAVFLFIAVGMINSMMGLSDGFFEALADQNNLQELQALIDANSRQQVPAESHMMFARAYLLSRLDKLNGLYDDMFYTYSFLSVAGSKCTTFPESKPVCFGLGAFTKIAQFIHEIINYLYYGYLFVYFQLSLLELMKSFFFYAFPAGIVLRAFPFTRSVGSYLIALAIGLYFVYPFFLSLLLLSDYQSLDVSEGGILKAIKSESPSAFLTYWVQQKLRHEEIASPSITENYPMLSGFETIASSIQFILLTMTLYPFVSFVAAYTFIHQFSALMQANVAELGRGLIKLI